MKKLDLPMTTTFSTTIDMQNIDRDQLVDLGDGKTALSFGTIDFGKQGKVVQIARQNGGQILYATTSIEQDIENILLNYFMGPFTPLNSKRELFEREVLQSSTLSYRNKKDLLSKVINESAALTGKKKNKLQSQLKKIMEWRNAFAHGKIEHDMNKGCLVRYYSGEIRELVLSEDKLCEIEQTFNECREHLKAVLTKVSSNA
ncbi:MAG: hypothetical protein AB2693_08625 [Candidatus Thiodiazotropha sp.]